MGQSFLITPLQRVANLLVLNHQEFLHIRHPEPQDDSATRDRRGSAESAGLESGPGRAAHSPLQASWRAKDPPRILRRQGRLGDAAAIQRGRAGAETDVDGCIPELDLELAPGVVKFDSFQKRDDLSVRSRSGGKPPRKRGVIASADAVW